MLARERETAEGAPEAHVHEQVLHQEDPARRERCPEGTEPGDEVEVEAERDRGRGAVGDQEEPDATGCGQRQRVQAERSVEVVPDGQHGENRARRGELITEQQPGDRCRQGEGHDEDRERPDGQPGGRRPVQVDRPPGVLPLEQPRRRRQVQQPEALHQHQVELRDREHRPERPDLVDRPKRLEEHDHERRPQ